MPKQATGSYHWTNEGPVARITWRGKARKPFLMSTCRTDDEAKARTAVLAGLVQRFRRANVLDTPDALHLVEMAATATDNMLAGVLDVAGRLVGGTLDLGPEPKSAATFGDVAKRWTSGELHRDFPDQVREIIQSNNVVWLDKYILPKVGGTPIASFTLDDADRVMGALPATLSASTRRQIAGIMIRVMHLAVYPCRLREATPIPRGWMPKPGPRKRFAVLYPSEDRQLLRCVDVPLPWRLFFGFLHREGMRRGEAVALRWKDLDLEHGTVSLDVNKTDHARFWKLGPGVARALTAWKQIRGEVEPGDVVFTDEHGRGIYTDHTAERVRASLTRAGVTRADLTSTGPNKGAFNTHSFRRSFVTRSLANGLGEDWVRARSGHKSAELLRYRQPANSLAELALGDVLPLDVAIPELAAVGQSLPRDCPAPATGTVQGPVMIDLLANPASGSCSGWPGPRRPSPGCRGRRST